MKRFIIIVAVIVALGMGLTYVRFGTSFVFDLDPEKPVTSSVRQSGKAIQMQLDGEWRDFEIRGVDLGAGEPGHYATDYAIDKETYLRWFSQIKAMGANTIRVYILLGTDFYEAFYEYNHDNPDPLYLIHGVWIDDYVQNSHLSAFDADYRDRFMDDCRTVVDVIHGNRWINLGHLIGSGTYRRDISPWVIGYILGVEWEAPTVAYTDELYTGLEPFQGEFISSDENASPFETMLASVGDDMLSYEASRYKSQRLLAFTNWPTTDPFDYPGALQVFFEKYSAVDVEHLHFSDRAIAGTFASYHVYPYYPDYLNYLTEYDGYSDDEGHKNTYRAYLETLVEHHSSPVVISEFGVPSSRGMAQRDANTSRNQGGMSEEGQGRAIAECYRDLRAAGCAGCCIFTWQDEWFKRTWNTMAYVDLHETPYWSDYQTNEQYFGLLSFDPGSQESVCYVDGDAGEWEDSDVIGEQDGRTLSMKYDEKFVYFLVEGEGVSEDATLLLPIDTTQKSGSTTMSGQPLSFSRPADFVVELAGANESRVLVQERYEAERAVFGRTVFGIDPYENPPAADTPDFVTIDLPLQTITDTDAIRAAVTQDTVHIAENFYYQTYETGKLTCGDANPAHEDFNSLADFCYGEGFVEVKLPWELLNFADASNMRIHSDYYEEYGVDYQDIDVMYVGVGAGAGDAEQREIDLFAEPLRGWGEHPTAHERLKRSYYVVQDLWANDGEMPAAGDSDESTAARGDGGQ